MVKGKKMRGRKNISDTESRRKFIRDTGVVVGGAAIGVSLNCSSISAAKQETDYDVKPWLPDKWDMEADVVVVGSGTGCAAAIEAAEAGAHAVIIEKQGSIGGTVKISAGGMFAAGTSVQKDLGIDDSPKELYDYLLALGGIEVDPVLSKILAERAVETFEWCRDHIGCKFPSKRLTDHIFFHAGLSKNDPGEYLELKTGFPNTPPRTHWVDPPTGETFVRGFGKKLQELGVKVLLEMTLKEIIFDPVDKTVLGLRAEKGGKAFYIKAKKGVVLATGGHGYNQRLVQNLELTSPTLAAGKIFRSPLITGDGIVAGMKVGGWFWPAVESGPDANPGLPSTPKTFFDVFETLPRIYVNQKGLRYVNELWYQAVQAVYMDKQPDRQCWCILDDKARSEVGWDFSRRIKKGIMAEDRSVRGLAEKLKIDPVTLEETINRWNGYIDTGKDPEWGRERSYTKSFKSLMTPPFYAAPMEIYIVGGYGPGLKINAKAQVVDIDQKPIHRLYATGSDSAGVMTSMYIGCGAALTIGFLFGRIAGKNAAEEKPWG